MIVVFAFLLLFLGFLVHQECVVSSVCDVVVVSVVEDWGDALVSEVRVVVLSSVEGAMKKTETKIQNKYT